jgi:hypothetical protein
MMMVLEVGRLGCEDEGKDVDMDVDVDGMACAAGRRCLLGK